MKIKFSLLDQKILHFLCNDSESKLYSFYQNNQADIVLSTIIVANTESNELWNNLTDITFDNTTCNKTAFSLLFSRSTFKFLTTHNLILKTLTWTCENEEFQTTIKPTQKVVCSKCSRIVTDHVSLLTQFSVDNTTIKNIKTLNQLFISEFLGGRALTNLEYMKANLNKVVPFLGSGISIPFNIPTWLNLVYSFKDLLPVPYQESDSKTRESFEQNYQKHDIFKMLDTLETNSDIVSNTEIFNKKIAKEIRESEEIALQSPEPYHNLIDIISLKPKLIITTNYDTLVEHYSSRLNISFPPMSWANYTGDIQSERTILHIHGLTDSPKDIVFSKKSYKSLYSKNSTNLERLSNIFSNKIHFFIGFSLHDKYVMNEFKHILKLTNGFMANFFINFSNDIPPELPKSLKDKIKPIIITYSDNQLQQFSKLGIDSRVFGIHILCMYLNNDVYMPDTDHCLNY